MARTEPINLDDLMDAINHDAKIIQVTSGGRRVICQWQDGSTAALFYRYGQWNYCEENREYQSQYAYACGYHD